MHVNLSYALFSILELDLFLVRTCMYLKLATAKCMYLKLLSAYAQGTTQTRPLAARVFMCFPIQWPISR